MTKTKEKLDKIQTHNLATERVYRDGDTYTLKAHSPLETDRHVPALVYDAKEKTIWSKGGRKLDVEVDSFEHWGETHTTISIDYRGRHAWRFGVLSDADAHQRSQIQEKRARALISYAISQ